MESILVCSDMLEQEGKATLAEVLRKSSVGPVTIWIVEGVTGEYSDHRDWLVASYLSEDDAKEHVAQATARASEIQLHPNYPGHHYGEEEDAELNNEWDSDMVIDYTGTRYRCYSVGLFLSTDDFQAAKGENNGNQSTCGTSLGI